MIITYSLLTKLLVKNSCYLQKRFAKTLGKLIFLYRLYNIYTYILWLRVQWYLSIYMLQGTWHLKFISSVTNFSVFHPEVMYSNIIHLILYIIYSWSIFCVCVRTQLKTYVFYYYFLDVNKLVEKTMDVVVLWYIYIYRWYVGDTSKPTRARLLQVKYFELYYIPTDTALFSWR